MEKVTSVIGNLEAGPPAGVYTVYRLPSSSIAR